MSTDAFAVVADPTRRRILDTLVTGDRTVGELASRLGLSQPAISKHLKVLRNSGFVTSQTDAQRRIYSLDRMPFIQIDDWLEPYRQFWNHHLDALERHLDSTSEESK
jgi:DNA-binding transcriptional ArsR family regulator